MRHSVDSIIDIVSARASTEPHSLAYAFLESGEREVGRLTWSDVDRRSHAIAAAIASRVESAARVLLLFPPGLDFIPAFVGCLRAGAVALPAYPPSGPARRRGSIEDRTVARLRGTIPDAGVSLVVTVAALEAKRSALEALIPELHGCGWLTVEDAEKSSPPAVTLPRIARHDIAFLQYTSGSTSAPRGVVITHGNLLHNLAGGALLCACSHESIGVSWLPINHDMGLIGGLLQPAFSGFPMWLMAPAAFLQRPGRWLQAISRLGATHSAGPSFAYELCARRVTEDDRRGLDLSTWRVAVNGSEPVRRSTLEHFQRAFGEYGFRWEAFTPAYGLAESTLLVSGTANVEGPVTVDLDRASVGVGRASAPSSSAQKIALISAGRPAEGTRVLTVDPVRLTRCAPDEIGEIWVSGESVAAGYWNRPAETAATFGAFVEKPREGPFLRTGDLGFVRDGSLVITGRIKDVLIVRGLKHYPQDLELTAERANRAVRPGCCAAFSVQTDDHVGDAHEAIVVLAETDASTEADGAPGSAEHNRILTDVRESIADAHQLQLCAVALVAPGNLPRTTSGKLQRFRCREAFLSGDLDVVASWTAPALELRRAS
jgi:acyl-CoA synthetase (AMP-forming)/AMP-acid ligase II